MTKHKPIRKSLIMILSFLMVFGMMNFLPGPQTPVAQAADSEWPATALVSYSMPFRPENSLVTTQNPPDFSWPFVVGADGYNLQVSRDASFSAVDKNVSLTRNFYNFPETFESGIWYWRVSYQKTGETPKWSTVRKFRIEEVNVSFAVPSVDTIIGQVSAVHPRVWTTPDTLDSFRALKDTSGKNKYESTLSNAMAILSNPLPAEPVFPYLGTSEPTSSTRYVQAQQALKTATDGILNQMMNTAFIYLVSEEDSQTRAQFGAKARQQLLNVASWDPEGSTSFVIQDQVHRAIAYKSAIVYDWIYDLLSDDDKAAVQAMVKERVETMIDKYLITKPMYQYPYDSHGWTILGYIGIIATAMLRDIPEAEGWFRESVPVYINLLPPWGGENGSWSQGTGYWQWSSAANKELMDVLLSAGAIDLYRKSFSRNEGDYPLYMFPHGTPKGVFGDATEYAPGGASVSMLNRISQMTQNPGLKWESEAIGVAPNTGLQDYFYGDADLDSRPPVNLPNAKWFEDTGFVAMHSDLSDKDRVSLYFRSNSYGTAIHNQADQNAFIINAYGESLAPKTGFYDIYGSPHHYDFTRQTFSANAITFDGKRGQVVEDFSADGQILGFATSPDFDATSGDATAAYKGALSKAVRHILYLRPDMFVVIDDLATNKSGGSNFEWNLHGEDNLTIDADQQGATVTKRKANLNVQFYTAAPMTATSTTKFLSANGTEVAPDPLSSFANEVQAHAQFITPKTNATKIISTMEVYKSGEATQNVVSESQSNYTKLTFEEGTKVYVRTTDIGLVGDDNIKFDGAAVAVKGNSVLLVNGTKVVKDGMTLIESQSDKPVTVVYGDERLSVSGLSDAKIKLYAPNVMRLRDFDSGADIPSGGDQAEAMNKRGVHWTPAGGDNILTLNVESGQKAFKLNNAAMPGSAAPVVLQTEIDGVAGEVTLQSYTDIDGINVGWGNLGNDAGFYEVVEAPAGLSFVKYGHPKSAILDGNTPIILRGDTGVLKLQSIGSGDPAPASVSVLPLEDRDTLSMIWQEAENYTEWGGGKEATKYNTRDYLSGGWGVSNWDQSGMSMKWNFNVPKAGKYDLYIDYVTGWDLPAGTEQSTRYLQIGDDVTYFRAPKTEDFGTRADVWRGLRVKAGVQLPAGPVDITMWHQLGGMNLDWLALIEVKDDEVRPSKPTLQLDAKTATSVDLSWTASTDPEIQDVATGVKDYVVYANGEQKAVIPAGTTTATVSGLTTGTTYTFTVKARDKSDNLSLPSNSVTATLTAKAVPVWTDTASIRIAQLYPDTVRLSWDKAQGSEGGVAYTIYKQVGATYEPLVTQAGTSYDVSELQPGQTYTFKVAAANDDGKFAAGGPAISVTMPAINANDVTFYESFDDWALGDFTGVPSEWTVSTATEGTNGPTLVQVVDLGSGNKGLKLIDNYSDGPYVLSPDVQKYVAWPYLEGGKVTVETKLQFTQLNHDADGYFLDLMGNYKLLGRFRIADEGSIAYQNKTDGSILRVTPYGTYVQLDGEWMTLRFDIDLNAKKYDITVQADSLKSYDETKLVGDADLDNDTGTLHVPGIAFLDNTITRIESVRIRPQFGTGAYTLDYLTFYRPQVRDRVGLAAKPSVGSQEEFPVTVAIEPAGSNGLYQEVELHYDTDRFTYSRMESARSGTELGDIVNDAANGVLRIKSTNDAALTGLTDVLKVIFQAKAGGTDGTIAVTEARIGSSEAGAVQANGLPLKTIQVQAPPTWDETAAVQSVAFPDTVRLSWSEAAAVSGTITSYEVYQVEGAVKTKAATVNGTTADITGLQPGETYTFKVEARDSNQSETIDGPELSVTLPLTSVGFYDSFDGWATSEEVEDGNGWTYIKNGGTTEKVTSVKVVELSESSKGLQAVDSYYDNSTGPKAYAWAPVLKRSIDAPYLDGLVTVETKVKFTKLDHDVNSYNLELAGGGKTFAHFGGLDEGAIGYRNVDGSYTRITPYNTFQQPVDEWMTIRFDIDFGKRTFDLIVQTPSLKTYAGTPNAAGVLDRETGTYRVDSLPFLDSNVSKLDSFSFIPQLYTGAHTLDYVTAYQTASKPSTPVLQLASRTATSVNLTWNSTAGSTALKEYRVKANGELKAVVPAGTTTANLTGLTAGESYVFTVVAVDSNDNLSEPSNAISLTMQELAPPVWGSTAAIHLNRLFTDTARLSWDPATVAEGGVNYTVYRQEGVSLTEVATLNGTSYDATLLQAGQTYTYKVAAANESGTFAAGGPTISFTTPAPVANDRTFYESFDDWELGEFAGDSSWTVSTATAADKDPTSVQVVDLGSGNKGLKLIDNYNESPYLQSPDVQKSVTDPYLVGGKVTVETKLQFTKLDHNTDGYFLDLWGNYKLLGRFRISDEGSIAYQNKTDGSILRITPYNTYAQPDGEWMTLRFDIDFDAKTYDITVQADSLKSYASTVAEGATLDKTTGTVHAPGIPFLDNTITRIESVRIRPQVGTGAYTLDYLTFYRPDDMPQNSVIDPVTANFDKSVTSEVYGDVSVAMTLNGNTLSGISNGGAALVEGTDYTAAGSAVTIKKEYLAQQPVGTTALTFTFSEGVTQTLTIAVSDSTVPLPSGDNIISLTPGSTAKTAGEPFQLDIGAASLANPFTVMDITISYDPTRLTFELTGDAGAEKLAAAAVESLRDGLELVNSEVIPELGKIRLFLGASSEANAATDSGPLFALLGEVKADAPLGAATVSLDQASGSMAGVSHDWQVTGATATISIAAVSKAELQSRIAAAQSAYDASREGSAVGEYPASARAALLSAIQDSNAVFVNGTATQAQVNAAVEALDTAISTFAAAVITAEPVNREALDALIATAQSRVDAAVEGTKVGQYAIGAKATLQAAIQTAANAVLGTQAAVDAAKAALQTALDTFAGKIVTLIPGATKVTIADLSLLVKFYGITSSEADWDQVAAADLNDSGKIDIVVLASVAQLILDDWRQQYRQ